MSQVLPRLRGLSTIVFLFFLGSLVEIGPAQAGSPTNEVIRLRPTLIPEGPAVSLGVVPNGARVRLTDFTTAVINLFASRQFLEIVADGEVVAAIPSDAWTGNQLNSWSFDAHLRHGIVLTSGQAISVRLRRRGMIDNTPVSFTICGIREPDTQDVVQIRTTLISSDPPVTVNTVPKNEILVLKDFVSEILDGNVTRQDLSIFADGELVASIPSQDEYASSSIRSWSYLTSLREGIVLQGGQSLSLQATANPPRPGQPVPLTIIAERRQPEEAPWNLCLELPSGGDPTPALEVPSDQDLLVTDVFSRVLINNGSELELFADGMQVATIPVNASDAGDLNPWAFDAHLEVPLVIPRGSQLSARLARGGNRGQEDLEPITLTGRLESQPALGFFHRGTFEVNGPAKSIARTRPDESVRLRSVLSRGRLGLGGAQLTLEIYANGTLIADLPSQYFPFLPAQCWAFDSQLTAGIQIKGNTTVSARLRTSRTGAGRLIEMDLRGDLNRSGERTLSRRRSLVVGADPLVLGVVPADRRFLFRDITSGVFPQETETELTLEIYANGTVIAEVPCQPEDSNISKDQSVWPWAIDSHFQAGIPVFSGETVALRLTATTGLGDSIPVTIAGTLTVKRQRAKAN